MQKLKNTLDHPQRRAQGARKHNRKIILVELKALEITLRTGGVTNTRVMKGC